ncbi:MAG: thioredoxin family protein [Burkholderiales bacterium]|nr:thioredoxin family protein [Burkholderiales bacterium]
MTINKIAQGLHRLLLASLLVLGLAQAALAEPARAYTDAAFKAAMAEGKAVLVEVHADWCPACKKQAPLLDALSQEAPYTTIVRFRVDFDQPGTALKTLKVNSQASLLLFKGNKEIARSAFDLDPRSIRTMLAKAG